jgi:hypothetical protein
MTALHLTDRQTERAELVDRSGRLLGVGQWRRDFGVARHADGRVGRAQT